MKRELLVGLGWGGGIILLALGATFARGQGYIDQDTVLRLVIGINGLMIAYYGNRAPKAIAPSICAQQLSRVSGWSMVLSGLVYVGLWAFAPISVAIWLGCVAVIAGMLATFAYGYRLRAQARTEAGR